MRTPGPSPLAALAVALAAALPALLLGARLEGRAALPEGPRDVTAEADADGPSFGSTQRLREKGDSLTAEYGFTAFNGDRLEVRYEVSKAELARHEASFGYSQKDVDDLKVWKETARKDAFNKAVAARKSQAELNADLAAVQKDYQRKLNDYFSLRHFILGKDGSVRADIPRYVRDGAVLVAPVAKQLDEVAQKKKYQPDALVGALTAMVQTALIYRIPPTVEGDKHTGGVLLPATALTRGWGDCDTKSALMGAVFKSWPWFRVMGVNIPGHYLIALPRVPEKGDRFIERDGTTFVLVEPAGPGAFAPGQVSEETALMLERSDAYTVEPF